MRPTSTGSSRVSRAPRRTHGPALGLTLALAAVALSPPADARAQATKKAQAPTELDMRPMARFVPGDRLVVLAASEGLDAHADAWAATAAHRMLNETPLGKMLEALAAQLGDRALAYLPNRKMTGEDLVTVVKHVAHKGFAFGLNAPAGGEGGPKAVLVLRGATAREFRVPFGRLLGTLMGESKPQLQKKGTRNIVAVAGAAPGSAGWVWWSEENDLVLGSVGTDEAVAAVVSGQQPSAVDHPNRAELTQPDGNFVPLGWMFIDPAAEGADALGLAAVARQGVERVDYRWGFSDDALMSVTRLIAPGERTGVLALFNQPGFDPTQMPPLPEGIEAFTAVSVEGDKALDAILAASNPDTKAQIEQAIDTFKTQSRLDLKADILAHVGPKMVAYILPESGGGPPPAAGLAGLGSLSGASALQALSGVEVPRAAIVAEVKDPVAFGKSLDVLMLTVNKEFKARAAEAAEAAEAKAAAANPNQFPGGEDPNRAERRKSPPPAPEFRLSPGSTKDKVYSLYVPSALSKTIPAGFRPSIRLTGNLLAVATAGDVARTALEAEAGAWKPSAELSAAFAQLPRSFTALNVTDPRPTMPELLAGLPANLQRAFNTIILLSQQQPGAPGAPGGPPGGQPGFNDPSQGPRGGSRGEIVSGGAVPGVSGPPGGIPGGPGISAPEAGGPPGGPQGGAPGAPALLQLQIAPEDLPKAEELRSRLFPGAVTVSSDAREIKIVTREAFPNLLSPTSAIGVALALPAVQAARDAAARAAAAAGLPIGGGPAGGGPGAAAAPPQDLPGGPGGANSPPPGNPRRRP